MAKRQAHKVLTLIIKMATGIMVPLKNSPDTKIPREDNSISEAIIVDEAAPAWLAADEMTQPVVFPKISPHPIYVKTLSA